MRMFISVINWSAALVAEKANSFSVAGAKMINVTLQKGRSSMLHVDGKWKMGAWMTN